MIINLEEKRQARRHDRHTIGTIGALTHAVFGLQDMPSQAYLYALLNEAEAERAIGHVSPEIASEILRVTRTRGM